MKFDVDISGVLDGIDRDYETLKENARPAAQKMAEAFYQQARENVLRLNQVTGNLLNSIYQKYDTDDQRDGYARYVVSWRTSGGGLARAPHGHLVEFGYIQTYARYYKDGQWYTNKDKKLAQPKIVPGTAFMRKAYELALEKSLVDGEETLTKGVAT